MIRPGFDLEEARLLARLSCRAYGDPDCPALPASWQVTHRFDHPETENLAIAAHSESQHALAFRGTIKDIENYAEDLLVPLKPSPDYFGGWPSKLHAGDRRAFECLLGPVAGLRGYLEDLARDKAELYVTGHSLGGALTAVCMAWLEGQPFAADLRVKSYSFASPKVGNRDFAVRFDMSYANQGMSYRVLNRLDPVPQLPLTIQLMPDIRLPARWRLRQWLLKQLDDLDYVHVGRTYTLDGESSTNALTGQHAIGTYLELLEKV